MEVGPLTKVAAKQAKDVCSQVQLGDEARGILQADIAPAPFLARLVEQELYADAVRFLAHALPKREAVWWACTAIRAALPSESDPAFLEALKAAEAWVYKPIEENRRAAMARAEAVGFDSPASWAAVAAFWSGGSMAPPDAPVVPPGETLTAAATAGAIMLAVVREQPEQAPKKYRISLEAGIDIANGGTGRKSQQGGGRS